MDQLSQTFSILLIVMLAGYGGYGIYCAIKLRKEGVLFPSKMLYPGNCSPDDCIDPVGFITYICPRLTIFGILCIVSAIATAIDTFIGFGLPPVLEYILLFAFLPVIIWYMIVQNKASKLYW